MSLPPGGDRGGHGPMMSHGSLSTRMGRACRPHFGQSVAWKQWKQWKPQQFFISRFYQHDQVLRHVGGWGITTTLPPVRQLFRASVGSIEVYMACKYVYIIGYHWNILEYSWIFYIHIFMSVLNWSIMFMTSYEHVMTRNYSLSADCSAWV